MKSERNMKSRGFTLIELLVALSVSLIVVGAIYSFLIGQTRFHNTTVLSIDTMQNARSAHTLMVSEIRQAGLKAPGASVNGIVSASATAVRIRSDLNLNGTIEADEDLAFSFDPVTLTISRNNDVLMDNVEAFSLTYTMADGSTTQTPADLTKIRKIRMSLRLRSTVIDATSRDYRRFELVSDIVPRNIAL